jgi:hypothetical protein
MRHMVEQNPEKNMVSEKCKYVILHHTVTNKKQQPQN